MRLGVTRESRYSLSVLAALVLFQALFLSCEKSDQASKPQELEKRVEVSFDLKDQLDFFYETKPNFDFSQVYEDSIELLVSANKLQHSIDFFRLDNGEKIDSVMLALEGPNGLPRLSNFLFESDTIYATNSFSYELVLFDLTGTVLKRIRIRPANQYESLLPRYFTPSQIVKIGDFIYLSGDPDLNTSVRDDYNKGKYVYEVNIQTGESQSVFEVPKIYEKDQWMINQYFYRQMYDEKRGAWLFSFEVDDSLRLYSLNGRRESYYAGSMVSGGIKKWNKRDLNSRAAYRYYLSNKSYSKLVYDKKNQLYYRFARHPNQSAMIEGDVDQMWMRRFSIIVLDKSLKWLGETEIKDKAFGEVHLTTNNGVYLSYYVEEDAVEGKKKYVKLNPVWLDEE